VNLVSTFWGWISAPGHWHGNSGIPERLVEHATYCLEALVIAAAIGVPLGLLTGHLRRGGRAVGALANLARALPTLGLLVLLAVTTNFGVTSLIPVLVTLVVLALPQILLNTYEGVRSADPAAVDAARGMGMSGPQVLIRVEAPIALPLILQGLRTAAFQVVATATIAAYVGIGGLGRFIIDGLASKDYASVVGGAVLVALVALVAEVLFALAERLAVSPGLRLVRSGSATLARTIPSPEEAGAGNDNAGLPEMRGHTL
jgi:osmoprotectant transport system permease protein